MASVIDELKKFGSYSTKTAAERQEALDLEEAGLINVSSGGSTTTINNNTAAILNCTATKKFKDLVKNGII